MITLVSQYFERSLGALLRAAERHFVLRRSGASVTELARSAHDLGDARLQAQRAVTHLR